MAKRLTKTHKQFIILGSILGVIIIVLVFVMSGGGGDISTKRYTPKTISTDIADDVFDHPEFKTLHSPVSLPLTPGNAGRDNPFEPFN